MSLTKRAENFKKKMSPEAFELFMRSVKQSVDLSAKNTKNLKNKDLAELQIDTLANRYMAR